MTETVTITLTQDDAGKRLDRALADHAPEGLSRARIQALMEQGMVTQGGKAVDDASSKVKGTETFDIVLPPPEEAEPRPQDIALDIVYEDKDLLVLNKPAGLVVHPAAGNHDGTLVNALLAHCGDTLSGIGGVKRPGIVHRLDKDTSGLMVVAKNDSAHQKLSAQLSDRSLSRVYRAIVWGVPSPREGRVETLIARSATNRKKMTVTQTVGKEAITDYTVLENFGTLASLVECRLQTGRTHQIRVHMAHLRHWIAGDPVYSCPSPKKRLRAAGVKTGEPGEALGVFPRQALHAAEISFIHPATGKKMSFSAAPPEDMQKLIAVLRKGLPGL